MVDTDADVSNLMSRVTQKGLSAREGKLEISEQASMILHRLGEEKGERGRHVTRPEDSASTKKAEETRAVMQYMTEESGCITLSKNT